MRIKLTSTRFLLSVSLLIGVFIFFVTSVSAIGKPTGVPEKGKFRACQAKENSIKNRFTHLTNLTTNMESKFDSIADRVKEYYSSKVVSSGKIVKDYETLVSDIYAKKTAVQTVLTTAQNSADSFSCASDDPKGQLTQFRNDMQNVKSALKDYRTSIKNLIVAVHSVNGSENTDSPKSTKTE